MLADDSGLLHPTLSAWIAEQRWFAGKGAGGEMRLLGSYEVPADPSVRITVLLVQHRSPTSAALYQVPITVRASGDGPAAAFAAVLDGETIGDAPRDPAFAEALLPVLLDGVALGDALPRSAAAGVPGGELAGGPGEELDRVAARGVPLTPPPVRPRIRDARVLTGEQSNTSVILDLVDGDGTPVAPVIVKIFRALHHGENPDVVLQSAIAAAGSRRVPATVAALVGTWPDSGRPDGRASGHLAVAQEFLRGAEDAWRVALRAANRGEDFRAEAEDLGRATAEVHRVLASALPSAPAGPAERAAVLGSMRTRARLAEQAVPALADRAAAIDAALAAGAGDEWPALQRIHGDLHLGQVLQSPERGWILLDFEGEPMRPMAERSEPDVPLRDVAGMLRSFDYVTGAVAHGGVDGAAAAVWAAAARAAFLDGYEGELGASLAPFRRVLDAFELDKALYECVYEARNRPDWLGIPESAVFRILERQA